MNIILIQESISRSIIELGNGAPFSIEARSYEDFEVTSISDSEIVYDRQQVIDRAKEIYNEIIIERIGRQRAEAYSQEADPLFFKYQRGEVTKEEWEAKVEEIRTRYPYPS